MKRRESGGSLEALGNRLQIVMGSPPLTVSWPSSHRRNCCFALFVAAYSFCFCLPAWADSPTAAELRSLEAALHEIALGLQVSAVVREQPVAIFPEAVAVFPKDGIAQRANEQHPGENAVPGLRSRYRPVHSWVAASSSRPASRLQLKPDFQEMLLAQATRRAMQPDGDAGQSVPSSSASAVDSDNAVAWGALTRHSMFFLGVQHSFRLATEEGTREGLKGPFFRDWYRSLSSLHGWSDGDPFFVNYIGHPMQGGVSGFIWRQNDPKYRAIEFGNNADYWRSLVRSMAFSFVYSAQFEIGPLSEATIGAIQSRHPQQGFVDHVVTPTIGTLWMLGEDILDRYVIRRVEGRTENVFLRMMVRGWLNPTRSFANLMRFRVPWIRDSRSGIWKYKIEEERVRREAERLAAKQSRQAAREARGDAWDRVAPLNSPFRRTTPGIRRALSG
jgi:hypothetical protein